MAKYPHVVWKDAQVQFGQGNPLLPFYATQAIELTSVSATSATNLTAFASYYEFYFTGTIVLDASGKAPYGPAWWADLFPIWSILTQPSAIPPYPSRWPPRDARHGVGWLRPEDLRHTCRQRHRACHADRRLAHRRAHGGGKVEPRSRRGAVRAAAEHQLQLIRCGLRRPRTQHQLVEWRLPQDGVRLPVHHLLVPRETLMV